MLADIVHPHRLKRPGTDVQGDKGALHARLIQPYQHIVVEMQTGGRRCDGTRMARVHRLITFAVARVVRAFDIGRERNMTDAFENFRHWSIHLERQSVKFTLTLLHGHGNIPFQR